MKFDLAPFIHSVTVKKIDMLGVKVCQNGEEIGSFRWWQHNDRMNIRSASKGVISLAAGIAINEGLFQLNDTISSFFEGELPADCDPKWHRMTVRNLLTMATGHEIYLLQPAGRDAIGDSWLPYIFSQPIAAEPGARFVYNNAAPYMMSCLIKKATGQDVRDWLMPRLFEPLGIKNPQWFRCPKGISLGLGGLFLSIDELARLGQLCLDRGVWNGHQLVPAEWIDEAGKLQIKTETTMGNINKLPEKDFAAGYGYFFWRNRTEGYRFNGKYGQFCIVLPERNAVVTTTALEEKDEQGILDSVWEEILPRL